jgi:D-glycero-alpha-D-manno-heptose 1-phosphate guanylyltransferase
MTASSENQATRAADQQSRGMSQPQATPALLLVGGLGTRLRSVVPSAPKPLASVGNKSFLELLIRQLKHQGVRRLILCTGYLADQVENEFGDGRALNLEISYSRELEPLGTAGAVKLAQSQLGRASEFLVMNGDSFLEIDLQPFIQFHRERHALVSMAVLRVEDSSRYGTVKVDSNQKVIGFVEKAGSKGPGLVNGGIYVFSPEVFDYIPEGRSSLEKDVFPRLLGKGVYAQEQSGMFIDIGTPEDYARAQELCDRLYRAALS